jgi:putative transposase
MNLFLTQLSEQYPDDVILLCCDSAAWHISGGLNLPDNIVLFYIPPYTPEMNPIEQIWKEIRKRGFHNEVFASLEKVVEQLCDTICSLSNQVISSISGRDWIIKAFN